MSHDDLVAMLRELNPLLGHGGGKTVNEAADAIERLSARIAGLEKEKSDFHMQYRMKCDEETKRLELRIAELESGQGLRVEDMNNAQKARYFAQATKDYIRINGKLSARIQLLESGQPVPHRGEMWQLVPTYCGNELASSAVRYLGGVGSHHVTGRDVAIAFSAILNESAMLTASAQEAKEK